MSAIELTQLEADRLIALEKHVVKGNTIFEFPDLGGKIDIDLISKDKKENFILDIYKGRIDLKKVKYQNRVRKSIILLRLDLNGPPHRNPDDSEIPCPHIHIYQEGFADKWAFVISSRDFTNTNDLINTLEEFMNFCNITIKPTIQPGLFS